LDGRLVALGRTAGNTVSLGCVGTRNPNQERVVLGRTSRIA
jgi:hypothetical protein